MHLRPAALALLAALLAGTLATTGHGEESDAALPRWAPGEREGTVRIGDRDEGFVALVPKGYTPRKRWPLVLLAHGNGGRAVDFLRAIAPLAGRKPPLLVSLERCDNTQDAVGYVPRYREALATQFAIDEESVFALGFSGGGFRLWDDLVCQAEQLPRYRGVVLVGSARQSFDPPERPARAPTVILVGDPRDPNFGEHRVAAEASLAARGYEVIVHEHAEGHSLARKPLEAVFAWIEKTIAEQRKAARRSR